MRHHTPRFLCIHYHLFISISFQFSKTNGYHSRFIWQKRRNNNLEVFTTVADGKSNVNENIKDYTIDSNANVYVYDYAKSVKFRVDAGFVPNQSSSIFNKQVFEAADTEKTEVIWSKVENEDVPVNYALIKTVDGDVTDVVIYIAD